MKALARKSTSADKNRVCQVGLDLQAVVEQDELRWYKVCELVRSCSVNANNGANLGRRPLLAGGLAKIKLINYEKCASPQLRNRFGGLEGLLGSGPKIVAQLSVMYSSW